MSASYDRVMRAQAAEMVAAIQYQDTPELAKRIQALEAEKAARKAAKKGHKQKEIRFNDAASVNSFDSTVGLLKARLSRKYRKSTADSKSDRADLETSRINRSQVKMHF